MTPSQEAVAAALKAEHAAVYLYGLVEAHALPNRKAEIATYAAEHRAQRDALARVLEAAKVPAPETAPSYEPHQPVVDPVSAATTAAAVEDDVATAHRALLEAGDSDGVRHLGVTGLGGAAVRGARWRVALLVTPVTSAFPGIRA